MAFREVRVFEVREVLRLWLAGEGFRSVERLSQVDRKTVRRYVDAAERLGLGRDGGDGQLTDALVGMVVEAVRPHRSDGHGAPWRLLCAHHEPIAGWVKDDLTGVKIHELLERQGVVVPLRTVQRYVLEVCGRSRGRGPTVRIADGEPGDELQVDFGRMGFIVDVETGRRRVVQALIFTACYSRHCFAWLTFRQTTEAVIDGFEAAWGFFGGVFATVIPENVPRNILRVLFPIRLCGRRRPRPCDHGGERARSDGLGHITIRAKRASRAATGRSARRGEDGVPPKNPEARCAVAPRSSLSC